MTRQTPRTLTPLEYAQATLQAKSIAVEALHEQIQTSKAELVAARSRRRLVELQTRKLRADADTLRQQIEASERRLREAEQLEAEAALARSQADEDRPHGNLELLAAESADWSRRHPDALRKLSPNRTLRKVS